MVLQLKRKRKRKTGERKEQESRNNFYSNNRSYRKTASALVIAIRNWPKVLFDRPENKLWSKKKKIIKMQIKAILLPKRTRTKK